MGWGGLQLATRQCDSEVLKGLPDWTRSTSSHTHTRFDGLSKHTSAVQTNERVGGGGGWGVGGVAVSNQTVQTSRSDGLQTTSSDTRSEAIPFPRSEANYFLRSEATPSPTWTAHLPTPCVREARYALWPPDFFTSWMPPLLKSGTTVCPRFFGGGKAFPG